MLALTTSILLILNTIPNGFCGFPNFYPKIEREFLSPGDDPGAALFLTPYVEQGKIEQAQRVSAVYFNGFKQIKSYAGYLTVNKAYFSNMFFWYFPSQTDVENDPVVLWLQGGPGATSMFGLFAENGPFSVKNKHGLKLRKFSWSYSHSVIYIDNPVGTGYSFTNDTAGYAQNETQVGMDLHNALTQFFTIFPNLQKNDFYVAGESYAGKYVPAVAHVIDELNPTSPIKINLKGISIGNGFCDPINQLIYSDYLYQIGLVDSNDRDLLAGKEKEGIELIKNGKFKEAFKLFDDLLDGDLNNGSSLFKNITGFENYFNFLYPIDPSEDDLLIGSYIQRADVRAAIHVGNMTFNVENPLVEINLINDVMQSITDWLSQLLSKYRVLIYNGQLDIIVAYPLTENFLKNLQFNGADDYKTAKRIKWKVGDDLAGYVKHAGNLTEVLVRNAGHMVPHDQPAWAFDLITRFTRQKKI